MNYTITDRNGVAEVHLEGQLNFGANENFHALLDKLLVLVVDPKERARITAIVYVIVIIWTSPFGWIAGQLSEVDRILPFILCSLLYAAASLLAGFTSRLPGKEESLREPYPAEEP